MNNKIKKTFIEVKKLLTKCQKDSRNIYDITMNERCEAQVQELFLIDKGFHKSMIELIDNTSLLQDKIVEIEKKINLLFKLKNKKLLLNKKDVEKKLKKIHIETNNVLYFKDNSDYLKTLYSILHIILGDEKFEKIDLNKLELM